MKNIYMTNHLCELITNVILLIGTKVPILL